MTNPETLCDINNPYYELRADLVRDFLGCDPFKYYTIKGHSFFEDPHLGDEVGLVMLTPDCQLFRTDLYDATRAELVEVIDQGIADGFSSFGDFARFEFV